jgi:hypothetical protein
VGFALALGLTGWVALRPGASPGPAAAVLYLSTVAYGVAEMLKLRERVLFGPGRGREGSPSPAGLGERLRWWLPRLLLVLVVAALPAALLLGGLPDG